MAHPTHLKTFRKGVTAWNEWRRENPTKWADLSGERLAYASLRGVLLNDCDLRESKFNEGHLVEANLSNSDASRANFCWASLIRANLDDSDFFKANLGQTNLKGASLRNTSLLYADLGHANLEGADLTSACLHGADLSEANLRNAVLRDVDVVGASLTQTNLRGADLTGARVYGIAVWDCLIDKNTRQLDLVITREDSPVITVDNIEVAQFVYLLLKNAKLRSIIDAITTKAVLILGRFSRRRKAILDAIREELRKHNYVPLLFDFTKPDSRDFTETIRTLAHMARFVVADITSPSSVPQELQSIVPSLSIPVQLLISARARKYGMVSDFTKYPWVLPLVRYKNRDSLLSSFECSVINPAEERRIELKKARLG